MRVVDDGRFEMMRMRASISGLVALAFTASVVGCAGWVPGRQSYWDAKVREMCAHDGGITIYETVYISRADVDRGVLPATADGRLSVAIKQLAHRDAPVYAVENITRLNERNPRVTRVETLIVRAKDQKMVGKRILYARFGGDVPTGIAEESSFACPPLDQLATELHQKLFIVEGPHK